MKMPFWKNVRQTIPLLFKEGWRVSAGVVKNVAKPPCFKAVRFAIIYKVASHRL